MNKSQRTIKRSFIEAYTSEEDEENDINDLQNEFEKQTSLSYMNISTDQEMSMGTDMDMDMDVEGQANNVMFSLEISDEFGDWDSTIKYVKKHATENGFKVIKCRIQKNKKGEIVRRTFECKHSREYHAKKKADIEDNRERESVKIGCPWTVNFYLSDDLVKTDAAKTYEKLMRRQREEHGCLLNEIRHTQIFSETVKQNLSCQVKYNQGFGYAKRAVNLALETGHENELNELLLGWIKETGRKVHSNSNKTDKENLLNISNPYLTRTKGASKKHIKSALENSTTKHHDEKIKKRLYVSEGKTRASAEDFQDLDHQNERQLEAAQSLTEQHNSDEFFSNSYELTEKKVNKYICSHCRSSVHNSRTCELKRCTS
ncbi:protein far1-related sequence 5-like [Gigaspora margarita]|uniref:Protein far1-related sequence 5-like n=1 Tax=Gigaspora margarita TaxID=4874 RepID=A0A8H4AIG3_GIGMA|nr:protein far1-related sequence 5-like [Gigaspora margarita]